MKNVKKFLRDIGAICLLCGAGVLIVGMYWAHGQFGEVDISTIIFHLKQPLDGSSSTSFS
jgi:hypothetical protein